MERGLGDADRALKIETIGKIQGCQKIQRCQERVTSAVPGPFWPLEMTGAEVVMRRRSAFDRLRRSSRRDRTEGRAPFHNFAKGLPTPAHI
jgi:hypothetical protein